MVQCWICYAEQECSDQDWVAPCCCRGSLKWVHNDCILSWIRKNDDRAPCCPHCREPFRFAHEGRCVPLLAGLLERYRMLYAKTVQMVSSGLISTLLYGSLYTYGLLATVALCGAHGTASFVLLHARVLGQRGSPLAAISFVKLAMLFPLAPFALFSLRSGDTLWLLPISSFVANEVVVDRGAQWALLLLPPLCTLARLARQSLSHAEDAREEASVPGAFPDATDQDAEPATEANLTIDGVVTIRTSLMSMLETLCFPFLASAVGFILCRGGCGNRFRQSLLGAGCLLALKAADATIGWGRRAPWARLAPRQQ